MLNGKPVKTAQVRTLTPSKIVRKVRSHSSQAPSVKTMKNLTAFQLEAEERCKIFFSLKEDFSSHSNALLAHKGFQKCACHPSVFIQKLIDYNETVLTGCDMGDSIKVLLE